MGKINEYKEKILRLILHDRYKKTGDKFPGYTQEEIKKLLEIENGTKNNDLNDAVAISNYFKSIQDIYLDNRVEDFIEWYTENMVKGHYTDIGEFHKPTEMRNFIEKMAVWYELRYPDYELNRLIPGSGQEPTKVSEVMFVDNPYTKGLVDENSDVNYLDWDELYNTKAFINSLPHDEKCLLTRPHYVNLVYLNSRYLMNSSCEVNRVTAHIELTNNGIVIDSDGIDTYTKFKIKGKDILGKHINDVLALFDEKEIELPEDSEIIQMVDTINRRKYQKEEMLNCVMYRIIERGGNRFGPRRAFLFAKEFGRNIDVPMMYGVDTSDPGLRYFMNEYLKAGGNPDLECYENYFSRRSNNEKIKTITINELYKFKNNYTPEEKALYERMVTAIATRLRTETNPKEKVEELRLQRKLAKSRTKGR